MAEHCAEYIGVDGQHVFVDIEFLLLKRNLELAISRVADLENMPEKELKRYGQFYRIALSSNNKFGLLVNTQRP
jgi:hypothetical protein